MTNSSCTTDTESEHCVDVGNFPKSQSRRRLVDSMDNAIILNRLKSPFRAPKGIVANGDAPPTGCLNIRLVQGRFVCQSQRSLRSAQRREPPLHGGHGMVIPIDLRTYFVSGCGGRSGPRDTSSTIPKGTRTFSLTAKCCATERTRADFYIEARSSSLELMASRLRHCSSTTRRSRGTYETGDGS